MAKMSPEWWRERYRNRTPEQRAEHIRECSERRRVNMATDAKYAARTREGATDRARAKRRDPNFLEKERDYMRERRARMPELAEMERQRYKARRRADIVKYLIKGAQSRSVKRGHDFDLTLEWARQRWTGKCELTGIVFVMSQGCIGSRSPSLDKIDPAKGYTQGNCRFILASVNSFKGAWTDEEMIFIATALVARRASSPI